MSNGKCLGGVGLFGRGCGVLWPRLTYLLICGAYDVGIDNFLLWAIRMALFAPIPMPVENPIAHSTHLWRRL